MYWRMIVYNLWYFASSGTKLIFLNINWVWVIEFYQSGQGYKAIAKVLGLHCWHMATTWNSGEPAQEWPADQDYPTLTLRFCCLLKKSCRRMCSHLFVASSWFGLEFCSWTMIQNTAASPPLNGLRKTKRRLYGGLVKVLTWNWLWCCGVT